MYAAAWTVLERMKFRWHLLAVVVGGGLLAWFCVRDGLLAWVPGHYPWDNIQIVPVRSRSLPVEESKRALSDLPTLLLGISSLGSAFLYGQLGRHLQGLGSAMKQNLIVKDSFRTVRDPDFAVFGKPVPTRLLWVFWLTSAGMGVGLFFLARDVRLYPTSWWLRQPPGTGWFEHVAYVGRIVLWIFVGAEGVFTAFASMAAFLAVTASLQRLRVRSQPQSRDEAVHTGFAFEYVEPWSRPQQGWGVLWTLMRLKVWGVLTALPALSGLYLILAQRESFRPLLAVIILGILIVSLRQFAILNLVPCLYEDTVGRELAANHAALAGPLTDGEIAANARRDEHLRHTLKNQRGYTLIVGRLATGLTLATSVAGVVLPLLTG